MIPRAHITAWRSRAPWPSDAQIEQDLALSRALIEPLLATGANYNIAHAGELIRNRLAPMLRGKPWKGKVKARGG